MIRKQQKSSAVPSLESVEKRRVMLQVMLEKIEAQISSIQARFNAINDAGRIQQMRRKLRYPSQT